MVNRLEALGRFNRSRFRHIRNYLRSRNTDFPVAEVRGVFHWKYSSVLAFFFWSMALVMVQIGIAVEPFSYLFTLARLFVILGSMWFLAFWLTSEELQRKKPRLTEKQKKRGEKVSLVNYRLLKWGVSCFLLVISVLGIRLINKVELNRELTLLHGRLLPSDEVTPPNSCSDLGVGTTGDGVLVLMGFATSYVDSFPHTVISVDEQPRLVVNRDADKSVWLALDILGADNKVIAELGRDGFHVREHSYFKFSRNDRSSLEIIDEYGQEVLNVRYVNPRAIWINAVLRYPGSNPVIFHGSGGGGICTEHAGKTEINFSTKPKM